jgi:hypothetical protein
MTGSGGRISRSTTVSPLNDEEDPYYEQTDEGRN